MDGTLARALLGVPTYATSDLIRRAFRVAAFNAHPDQGGDDLRFRQVVAARDLLLETAPEPTTSDVADRFRAVTRPPAETTLDVTDIVRAKAPAAPPAVPTFDEVLASVLAA